MKKFLRYSFYFLAIIFLYYGSVYAKAWSDGTFKTDQDLHTVPVTGDSMEPTFQNGDKLVWTDKEKPVIGDVLFFQCLKDKCRLKETGTTVHRLTAIDSNGCMHIEGDNQPISWDTRDYGCLMPEDIQIFGVVHKITF